MGAVADGGLDWFSLQCGSGWNNSSELRLCRSGILCLALLPLVQLRAPPAMLAVVVHRPPPECREVERDQSLVCLSGQIGLQHHLQPGRRILEHQHLLGRCRLVLGADHPTGQAFEALGDPAG